MSCCEPTLSLAKQFIADRGAGGVQPTWRQWRPQCSALRTARRRGQWLGGPDPVDAGGRDGACVGTARRCRAGVGVEAAAAEHGGCPAADACRWPAAARVPLDPYSGLAAITATGRLSSTVTTMRRCGCRRARARTRMIARQLSQVARSLPRCWAPDHQGLVRLAPLGAAEPLARAAERRPRLGGLLRGRAAARHATVRGGGCRAAAPLARPRRPAEGRRRRHRRRGGRQHPACA